MERRLVDIVGRVFEPGNAAMVDEAFRMAAQALDGRARYDGTPLIDHSVGAAAIVVDEIGLDHASAIATLLHDAVRMGLIASEDVERRFGEAPAAILRGMNLISTVQTNESDKQADNFRDLILSYSADPRVILIKLADRLEVMRSLAMFPPEKRRRKSWESMNLYAQIAHKLGLYSIKSELEDIALGYLEPEDYRHIADKLRDTAPERDEFIARFTAPIEEKLKSQGIDYRIKGRTKSVYSIWKKMKRTGVPFEEVFDIFAIRIVIDCPPQDEKRLCWGVFSIVTDFYTPNPDRMRDWISIPKSNGYESLHTTVVTGEGRWVEIQIRTERMDEVAERGIAAHWRYKGVHGTSGRTEEWLGRLREVIEEGAPGPASEQGIDTAATLDEVFVFTPAGDLRKLPRGATVLDFAFDIHTALGASCTGARIGERNVSIRETLRNGDIVSIITSPRQKPKADWLSFVATPKARSRIKAYLREDSARVSELGREELERKIRNWKLPVSLDEAVTILTRHHKLKTGTELYGQIAAGRIDIASVKETIQQYLDAAREQPSAARPIQHKSQEADAATGEALVIDDSIRGLDYKFARCCNPIFGDDVFGFTTVAAGITIHRADCPNARRLKEQYPYRVLEARWRGGERQGGFVASLRIVAEDTTGILNRITEMITGTLKINIRSMSVSPMREGRIGGIINIEVANAGVVDMVAANLLRIKGVEKAYRVTSA